MRTIASHFLKPILLILLSLFPMVSAFGEEVWVYSSRKEHLIKPLFDQYKMETGVSVRYVTDKAPPLMARIKAEGRNTRADLFMTVDAGNLWQAGNMGILQPITSPILDKNVPSHLRDSEGRWAGLSIRARAIVYSTKRVAPSELKSYESLADDKWKGRLCLRTSKKVYNQSLVAVMMEHLGAEKTEETISAWVKNLATPVFSNDTKLMEAILAGQCDVGIVNTYYFGRLQKEQPDLPLAIFWPNQADRGVHVNISGAGVTRYGKHPQAAQKLLEWLSSPSAQSTFASSNMEYPVNPAVKKSKEVAAWGEFKADVINVDVAGRNQARAIMLMDRAKYH